MYHGSEESGTTEEICVALDGVLPDGTTTVTGLITPEDMLGPNAAIGKIYNTLVYSVCMLSSNARN